MPSATALALPADVAGRPLDLEAARVLLEPRSPQERLAWAQQTFGPGLALTTSFGIQAAVLLHMVSELAQQTGQPVQVIWVDTGYLPPETYHYADLLSERLQLRLHVAQAQACRCERAVEQQHDQRVGVARSAGRIDRHTVVSLGSKCSHVTLVELAVVSLSAAFGAGLIGIALQFEG